MPALLAEHPALLVQGPRAVGKSTTARRYADVVVQLDRPGEAAAFALDPDAALARHAAGGVVLLDEWQEVPEALWAVKRAVDAGAPPGSFVLTGSVRPRSETPLPTFGRIASVTMWPATQGEINRRPGTSPTPILDSLTADGPAAWVASPGWDHARFAEAIVRGGFPPVAFNSQRSTSWFAALADDVVSVTKRLSPRLATDRFESWLSAAALASAQIPALVTLLETVGVNRRTGDRYDEILTDLLLLDLVPAFSSNRLKRLARSPKRYLTDSGLAAHLIGVDAEDLLSDVGLLGSLLDTWVVMQIRAEIPFAGRTRLHHLRTTNGREIDLVIEHRRRVYAVEITAQSDPRKSRKAAHLIRMRDELGSSFARGVLLYAGHQAAEIDDRIVAVPLSSIFQSAHH